MQDSSNSNKLLRVNPSMEKKVRNLLEKTDLSPIAHSANLQIEIVQNRSSPTFLVAKKIDLEPKPISPTRLSIDGKKSPKKH